MSIYNNLNNLENNSTEFVEERLTQIVKQSFNTDWKTNDQTVAIKTFKSNTLTEEEYEMVLQLVKILRHCETYKEYKPAFDKFCKFCHILPTGTIIKKVVIKSGSKRDRNYLYVEYSYNTKKIKLEEGQKLFHISKVEGITELKPFFRGKSERGYLYDKPRVYLTVYKKMPKMFADYGSRSKIYHYEVTANINEVYVDPLLRLGAQGAVYVETNRPIPVKEFKP